MMTPMKRLRVKKDPNTMKNTKYMYMATRISLSGCCPGCKVTHQGQRLVKVTEETYWEIYQVLYVTLTVQLNHCVI